MSKTKVESVEIEYVDQLPMVNETNKFLVTKKAKDDFSKDLKEFFPFAMEKYILPRLLGLTKNKKRVLLFAIDQSSSARRFAPSNTIPEELLGGIRSQMEIAKKYLDDIHNVDELRGKLNYYGTLSLGILAPAVFDIFSYNELFALLIGEKKDLICRTQNLPLSRLLSIYLHNKECYLWPLKYFAKEKSWNSGNKTFAVSFLDEFLSGFVEIRKKAYFKRASMRLLRTLRWRYINDLNDSDIARLYDRLQKIDSGGAPFRTILNLIVSEAKELGSSITYITSGERHSKTNKTGRRDGTFLWVDTYGDTFKYWKLKAVNYVSDKHRSGLQSIDNLSGTLSVWFDYLCYLNSKGLIIASLIEVDRNKYIKYQPSSNRAFLSFTEWLHDQKKSTNYQSGIIYMTRGLFEYIIRTDNLKIHNPILELDAPKYRRAIKSYRTALTLSWWLGLIEMMFEDPPLYTETVFIDDKHVKIDSQSLQTYTLIRLYTGLRHHQAAYLDKDTVMHKDGILVSGDKNPNREILLIIPWIDERLKEKVRECIDYQSRYNKPAEPVWYNGHSNSPYGQVSPLFRPLGWGGKPFSRHTCDTYVKRCLLKFQKKANIHPSEHIVRAPDGKPFDMSAIDPDNMTGEEISKCQTDFDLHTLRVTAATIWLEAGVPYEIVAQFLTGHASLAMLRVYDKRRTAEAEMKDRFELLKERAQLEESLKNDRDKAIDSFFLISKSHREEDKNINGIEALKNTSPAFWRFFNYGICPTGACPNGLHNQCSLCPLFITGPNYMTDIAATINLTLEKIGVCLKEIGITGIGQEQRRAELESLLQEFVGWNNWYEVLKKKKQEPAGDNGKAITLYSQVNYELKHTSKIMLALQRCVDIKMIPQVYSEHAYYTALEMTLRMLVRTNPEVPASNLIKGLTREELIKTTADYYEKLVAGGRTEQEIEMLFSEKCEAGSSTALLERLLIDEEQQEKTND